MATKPVTPKSKEENEEENRPEESRPEAVPSFEINQDYKDNYLKSNYESDEDFELKNLEIDLHQIVLDKVYVIPEFANLRPLEIKDLTSGMVVKVQNQKKGTISKSGSIYSVTVSDGKVFEIETDDSIAANALSPKAEEIVAAIRKCAQHDHFWTKDVAGFSNILYGYIDTLVKKGIIERTEIKDKKRGAKFKVIRTSEIKADPNKIKMSSIDHDVDPIMRLKKEQLVKLYSLCEQELFVKIGKYPDIISYLFMFTEYFKVHPKYMFNCLPIKMQGNFIDEFTERGYVIDEKHLEEVFKKGIDFSWKPSEQ